MATCGTSRKTTNPSGRSSRYEACGSNLTPKARAQSAKNGPTAKQSQIYVQRLPRSKHQLRPELDLPRTRSISARQRLPAAPISHARDIPEIRACNVGARITPLRRVHNARRIRPQLKRPSLRHPKIPENRCVQIPIPRPADHVLAQIPELRLAAILGTRPRKTIRRHQRPLRRVEIANRVLEPQTVRTRPVQNRNRPRAEPVQRVVIPRRVQRSSAEAEIDRRAARNLQHPVHLPASQHRPSPALLQEFLPFAKWQLVYIALREEMRAIEIEPPPVPPAFDVKIQPAVFRLIPHRLAVRVRGRHPKAVVETPVQLHLQPVVHRAVSHEVIRHARFLLEFLIQRLARHTAA